MAVKKQENNYFYTLSYLALLITLSATLGSLYFSEILRLPPCVLCWYQRILMYPLVIIIAVGILRKDSKYPLYVLPFIVLGALTAFYHTLLQQKLIPEASRLCSEQISCTSKQIEILSIFTIPSLSLIAFIMLNILMFLILKGVKDGHK